MNTSTTLFEESLIGWGAFVCSEVFPVLTKELSKRGYGRQLNGVCDVFFFVVYTLFICGCINQATIWICETVFSRDIDGDGIKGKPSSSHERSHGRDFGSRQSSEEGSEAIEIISISSSGDSSTDSVVEHPISTEK